MSLPRLNNEDTPPTGSRLAQRIDHFRQHDRAVLLARGGPIYAVTGYTVELPYLDPATPARGRESITGTAYAGIDALEAAVTPADTGDRIRVAGWPTAGALAFFECGDLDGDAGEQWDWVRTVTG